jgi:hypothetical protein
LDGSIIQQGNDIIRKFERQLVERK